MAETGIYRTPALGGWQRTNVIAAANCLREQIGRTPDDTKLRNAYEGLLDLLDPSRLVARKQREQKEQSDAARHAATAIKAERRAAERRAADRRRANAGAPGGVERRTAERRAKDRRTR
jgi:hypothetical protein